jgi:hypothetical protein
MSVRRCRSSAREIDRSGGSELVEFGKTAQSIPIRMRAARVLAVPGPTPAPGGEIHFPCASRGFPAGGCA